MTDRHQSLPAPGAIVSSDAVQHCGETPDDYERLCAVDTLCDMADLGVLAVSGAKSADFLHGQTTADFVKSAAPGPIRGACCNPQGRVFTLFTAIATTTGYLLIMPRALVEPSRQALARYAALSRVTLADASADYRVFGLAGAGAEALVSEFEPPRGSDITDRVLALRHDPQRYLLLVPETVATARWDALRTQARPVGLPFWRLADIRAGIAHLTPATCAQFIPQMLNLERRGAVSFTKGCYTGQEVIARSQHLGKLKRHLYRLGFKADVAPEPGAPLLLPDGAQPAGTLITAAMAGSGNCEALAVLRDEAQTTTALDLGAGPQPVVFLSLPSVAA